MTGQIFTRLREANLIEELMLPYAADLTGYSPEELASEPGNIVVSDAHGSLAIAESHGNGIYAAHHFHPVGVRGAEALRRSKGLLAHLFDTYPEIGALRGYSPAERPETHWIARQLGFTAHGRITVQGQEFEMFILTRREFEGTSA